MTNILSDAKKQQVIALGQLGWTLRRIEQATGVRRETASTYLKAAGIAVRDPRHRRLATPNPASGVSTDPERLPPGITGPLVWPPPGRAPSASACAPYRELIEAALARAALSDHLHPTHASETALEMFIERSVVFGHDNEHPGIRK